MITIPKRLQVFDTPVEITGKDHERLSPVLTGWTGLAEVMSSINEPDLRRLIIMELMGKKRRKILGRLLQRLGSAHTQRIDERVWRLLPPGKPRKDFR